MGNKPSRPQVIEIKRVEIVRRPPDERDRQTKRRPEDDEEKRKEEERRRKEEERRRKEEERRRKQQEEDAKKANEKEPPSEKKPEDATKKKKKKKKTPEPDDAIKPDTAAEPTAKAERYESVTDIATSTSDVHAKENKIKKLIRLIGINQMSPKNFVIMFVLWSLHFFIPWVNSWWEFNMFILSDPAHLDNLESYLFMHEIIAFVGLSLLCVILSVFADVFNLKYFIYLALIAIFIICPITGIIAINVIWARGYSRPLYHRYSPTVYIAMYWVKSIPYVAFPLEFCCFFTQVDDMSREAHYNYAALFVFLDSVNRLICFYIVPGECPTLQWTLASVWIAIGVVIHTVFLLSCFFILWVKPANKVLNRSPFVIKVVRRINNILIKMKMQACTINETLQEPKLDSFNEKATPFMKRMKLILFGLMLVPIIFSSFVIAIMHRLELDKDWDRHEFHSAASMFVFGRVIGVIIIAVLLFFLRRSKMKILNKFPITKPNVLALGLPHVIIILALVLLAARFGSLHSLEENEVMIGPVPNEDRSVIEFYNADFRNRTVCVFSEHFRAVKIRPRHRETRDPPNPAVTRYEITVSLAPKTTPPVFTHEILEHARNSLITYVITLNSSAVTANDLEALYGHFQLNRVEGTESVRPKKEPQLIIINSFLLNTSSYFIYVAQFQRNFTQRIEIPSKERAHVIDLVAGRIDLRYENEGTNNSQELTPPILKNFEAEEYTVWSIVLGLATAHNASNETEPYNVLLNIYKIMQVAGPDRNPLPDKRQLQQDMVIMIGMCLGGVADAGMMVGLLYLFWLDTPIGELRVTTLACFIIFMSIPQEFPRMRLVDITTGVAVFLLCLQIMFTVAHFIGAIYLYDPVFNFRTRED